MKTSRKLQKSTRDVHVTKQNAEHKDGDYCINPSGDFKGFKNMQMLVRDVCVQLVEMQHRRTCYSNVSGFTGCRKPMMNNQIERRHCWLKWGFALKNIQRTMFNSWIMFPVVFSGRQTWYLFWISSHELRREAVTASRRRQLQILESRFGSAGWISRLCGFKQTSHLRYISVTPSCRFQKLSEPRHQLGISSPSRLSEQEALCAGGLKVYRSTWTHIHVCSTFKSSCRQTEHVF